MTFSDIWQFIGSPQTAEMTAIIIFAASTYLSSHKNAQTSHNSKYSIFKKIPYKRYIRSVFYATLNHKMRFTGNGPELVPVLQAKRCIALVCYLFTAC